MALVRARPFRSLIDEIVRLGITGLLAKQRVTLRANFTGDKGERFESSAHCIADKHGTVSVSYQPSVGCSYTGIEPLGLLWSMKPSPGQRKGIRLVKRDVTKPYTVGLDVFDGHTDGGENKRESIGILDLYGGTGGLVEMESSLLASHAFAALSLAYFGYDLPKSVNDVDYEYFEEAAEWMGCHTNVAPQGLGAMSVSSGSQCIFMLAIHRPDLIKAVVGISPFHGFMYPYNYKAEQFSKPL